MKNLILRYIVCGAAGTGIGTWTGRISTLVDNNLLKLAILLAGVILLFLGVNAVMIDGEGEEKEKGN